MARFLNNFHHVRSILKNFGINKTKRPKQDSQLKSATVTLHSFTYPLNKTTNILD